MAQEIKLDKINKIEIISFGQYNKSAKYGNLEINFSKELTHQGSIYLRVEDLINKLEPTIKKAMIQEMKNTFQIKNKKYDFYIVKWVGI